MIVPTCSRCGTELDEPGAVLIGPPLRTGPYVAKRHLCVSCYWLMLRLLDVA